MVGAPEIASTEDFRTVLGHFPTGVAVVTAAAEGHVPVGMVVGSFTSVSLDPPLVAFLPARSSRTFPKIREVGRFCVNVLAADQEDVCRAFARSGGPKFEGTTFSLSPGGCPILSGAVAWIDCELESVVEAGDHYICVGRVHSLEVLTGAAPLIFFKGGYGGFASASLAAPAEDDLVAQLLVVDLARREMERLSGLANGECMASAVVAEELVVMAVAGTAPPGQPDTRVGERIPFIPPVAPLFVAFGNEVEREAWLDRSPGMSLESRDRLRKALANAKGRGYAVGTRTPQRRDLFWALAELRVDAPRSSERIKVREAVERLAHSYDAEDLAGSHGIEYVGAPVFDRSGRMVLQLTVFGVALSDPDESSRITGELLAACRRVTESLGGHGPESIG